MDSRDGNVQQNHPTLCRNGCGFYSNHGNEGLCSVCYKDLVKKKQAPPTNMPASLAPTPGSMASLSIEDGNNSAAFGGVTSFGGGAFSGGSSGAFTGGSSIETGTPTVTTVPEKVEEVGVAAGEGGGAEQEGQDGKKKKNRCLSCKKKVGLTGFTCRCGGLFCSIHRYSDKHVCGFDYKALGAEEISKSNPVVVAEKVAKI
jgi:hypothetical protein